MNKAAEFLSNAGVFYIATTDGDQPRVRPFGGVFEFDGGVYIVSDKQKDVVKQMLANPKVEIACTNKDGEWLRITACAVIDDRPEVKEWALEQSPFLRKLHTVGDPNFACIRLTGARCKLVGGLGAEEFEF